jgi:integrase
MTAWIERRGNAYLVRWREPGGKRRSQRTATEDEAREMKVRIDTEVRTLRVLRDTPGIPGWDDLDSWAPSAVEEAFRLEDYLRRIVEQDTELRDTVKSTYLGAIRTRIEGTPLGQSDIRAITGDDVLRFFAGIERNRRAIYAMLAKGFNSAIRAGIRNDNPLYRAGIKKPRARIRPEERVLTTAELERLADGAAHPQARLAVLLMGWAGLRAGEVAGLRVQDVNFAKCRLSIRQQVVEADGRRYVSPPKTAASRRTITVPCSVTNELKDYVDAIPPAPDGRIFHRGEGRMISAANLNAMVHWAAHKAGLPPVHSHQLRHTAVSTLIDEGANAKQIQTYVGHATIGETLQTYGHLLDQSGDALAELMERRREAHRNGAGG